MRSMLFRLVMLSLLGALWPLSFAPLSLWWLSPLLLLALLVLSLRADNAKQAAAGGFAFGMGAFVAGVHWLYTGMHTFGGMPAVVAALGVVALSAYLSIYPALACFCMHRLSARTSPSLPPMLAPVWATVWTATELARGWVFTGFPWLSAGDALVASPFMSLLPWVGATACAWLLMTLVTLSYSLLQTLWRANAPRPLAWWGWAVAAVILIALPVLARLPAPFARQVGVVRMGVVQPNIPQSVKFDPDRIIDNVEITLRMAEATAKELRPGDWLLLPETALPVLWSESPPEWKYAFQDLASRYGLYVVMGVAIDDNAQYTNSVTVLNPTDTQPPEVPHIRYDKRHLVPFGEFIPNGFHWFVAMMNMPMGEFNRGLGAPQAFKLGQFHLLPHICYENVFSREFAELVRTSTPEPNILFNVSNLAWFGDSWALEQHAQMSQARSVEHEKPMVRATNTGVSGVTDAQGRWLMRFSNAKAQTGITEVPLTAGLTLYARLGDWLWLALCVAGCIPYVSGMRRDRYNSGL